jgi:tetratricopeptide (TPR) repeat protein
MAEIENKQEEVKVEQMLSKAEKYIDENQKSLMIITGAIIFVVLVFIGYKKMYLGPKEKEAQSQMFVAEQYFELDSFRLALEGDGNYLGFVDIVDEYGMTKTGNLASYYAGICQLRLGNFEEAIDYLKKFDASDKLVSPIALGAIGDAYMELEDLKQAVSFYKKAVRKSENEFTTPYFLMKTASTYELLSDYKKALQYYEQIQAKYPTSQEARLIEKYIARVKVLIN